ncbi:MAG: copper resistance protein CopC [Thermoplasmatota archaeon]
MNWRWVLLALLLIPGAVGHGVPFESSPAAGARLTNPPTEVVVHFTEPVYEQGTWIRVFNGDGDRVDNDDLEIQFGSEPVLTVTLPPLPDAPYRIQWQTYSQTDGHTVGGSIGFAVGSFAPPATESADADGASPTALVSRMLQYVAYALIAGALLALLLHWPGPARKALLLGAGLQVLGHGMLLLDNANATGLGSEYLGSEGGTDLLLRTIGWAVFGLVSVRLQPGFLAALVALLGWMDARFGHASQQGAWAIGVEWVHLLSVSLWVGGLVWFVRYAPFAGKVFGRIALWSVVVLAVSGFALTVGILQEQTLQVAKTLKSAWGKLLLAKLVLVAVMLVLAAVNRFGILGEDGDPGAKLRQWLGTRNWTLKRVAGTEAAMGVATLLVAAALLSVGAPTGAALTPAFFEDMQGFDASGTLQITPEPTQGAEHLVRVYLLDESDGSPIVNNTCGLSSGCIKLSWFADSEGALTAQTVPLESEGDGWWNTKGLVFFDSGNHTVSVAVNTAWFEDTLFASVPVNR